MDRLDAMRVLVAVVDEGSISAGARLLRAPLPTVSRKISDLEKHLGTSLLVRTARRIELTDAGREYVEAARQILESVQEAELIASGEYREPRGELVLTAPVSLGHSYALPLVLDFLKTYPEIGIRLQFSDARASLIDENIHVGLRVGELTDPALIATRVGTIRLATFASPAYLDQAGSPQRPGDLAEHCGISTVGWRFRFEGKDIIAKPRHRLTVNSQLAAIEAALAGIGIARAIHQDVQPRLASGNLVEILPDFALPEVPVHLIYSEQGILPLKLRAFLNFMAPRLRSSLKIGAEAKL
jgi:DNA-binding transcriptional LysR family regulator